jgi:hypothetical protein
MGTVYYARHFGLLACLAAFLAATPPWAPTIGVAATFGIYGALHAGSLAVTLRARRSAGLRLGFVASGASLSMLSVALGACVSRFMDATTGIAQTALLLSLSSGFGAASYAGLIRRFFGAHLTRFAIVTIALGCMGATLTVLVSGMHLKAGGLWVAASWWFAMSLGLWSWDERRTVCRPCLESPTMGPSDRSAKRSDDERKSQ